MAEESNNAPEAAADGAQQAGPQFGQHPLRGR